MSLTIANPIIAARRRKPQKREQKKKCQFQRKTSNVHLFDALFVFYQNMLCMSLTIANPIIAGRRE